MKKGLLLFFAFLLPILIYFFLKAFGKNEFEVPVLFADSVSAPATCNQYTYKAPYTIADSILQKTDWNDHDSLTIYVFEDGDTESRHERNIHITRIFDQFETEPLHVFRIYKDSTDVYSGADRLTNVYLLEKDFFRMRNCVFLLPAENDAIIIDHQKRIRGQYNLAKREDADRMIMEEMNILFKRY